MLKNLSFYFVICLLVMASFLTLTPYPTFSEGGYNLSQKDISLINQSSERESYEGQQTENPPALVSLEWKQVDRFLKYGQVFELVDLQSEKSFSVVRVNGKNHADICGATEEDGKNLQALADQPKLRPVLISLSDGVWTGASMSTKIQTDNDEAWHFCLYFDKSKAHCTNLGDINHQKTIAMAFKLGQKYLKNLSQN